MDKKIIIGIGIILILIVTSIFIFSGKNSETTISKNTIETINVKDKIETISVEEKLWWNSQLKDIRTGKKFKISDFSGKIILLESFAVWCPTCTKQQKEIKKFEEIINKEIISISLDTDPNEDESKIKKHIEENNFDWYYAISPIDLTKSLIADFSIEIVNAPSAPIILICEDGQARKLERGIKKVDDLKIAIESCN